MQEYTSRAGDIGELKVSKLLNQVDGIKVWNDFHWLGAQIDHVVLYWTGFWFKVLCIETKNWSGVVSGNCYDMYWSVDCHGKVSRRYNPIMQNRKHKSLLKLLFWWCSVESIVVMVGSAKYPRFEKWQCGCEIMKLSEFRDYLGIGYDMR